MNKTQTITFADQDSDLSTNFAIFSVNVMKDYFAPRFFRFWMLTLMLSIGESPLG